MKQFEEGIVDNDYVLNIVNEIKFLIEDDRYKNDSIKELGKGYPDKIEKLEETLRKYMDEADLKILKFPDKWKYLTKNLLILMNILIVSTIITNLLII